MRYGQLVNTPLGIGFVVEEPDYAGDSVTVMTAKRRVYLSPEEAARSEPISAQCIDGFFTFAGSLAIDTYGPR